MLEGDHQSLSVVYRHEATTRARSRHLAAKAGSEGREGEREEARLASAGPLLAFGTVLRRLGRVTKTAGG